MEYKVDPVSKAYNSELVLCHPAALKYVPAGSSSITSPDPPSRSLEKGVNVDDRMSSSPPSSSSSVSEVWCAVLYPVSAIVGSSSERLKGGGEGDEGGSALGRAVHPIDPCYVKGFMKLDKVRTARGKRKREELDKGDMITHQPTPTYIRFLTPPFPPSPFSVAAHRCPR